MHPYLTKTKNIIHIAALKITSHFGILLGRIIIACKLPLVMEISGLETIYLNRADRIGDAVISKPFIRLLIEFIRQKSEAKIVIIASQYNRGFLQDLESPENGVTIVEERKDADEYESKLGNMIWKHIKFLWISLTFRFKQRQELNKKELFIDLTGGGSLPMILTYKMRSNPVVAGPNIFWGSHVLDIALPDSYIHYCHRNLIEGYIAIIEKIFSDGVRGFREFVYDHIESFYRFDSTIERTKDICLFVGTKEFRNLPNTTWERTIRTVAAAFPDRSITVVDDPSNILYEAFKDLSFPNNVTLMKNTHSFGEFEAEIAKYRVVVGVDGGGINLVRTLTNSLSIYTFAHHDVWSCFTGRDRYEDTRHGDWHIGRASLPHGQIVGYMYKESWMLPTFNILSDRALFADFDAEGLVEFIGSVLEVK